MAGWAASPGGISRARRTLPPRYTHERSKPRWLTRGQSPWEARVAGEPAPARRYVFATREIRSAMPRIPGRTFRGASRARARPSLPRRRATRASLPRSRLTLESLPIDPPGHHSPAHEPRRLRPEPRRGQRERPPLRARRSHRTHPEQAHDHGRTHHVALPRQSPGLSPGTSIAPLSPRRALRPLPPPRVSPRPASAGDVDMPTRRALEFWLTSRTRSPTRPRRRTEATTALPPAPPAPLPAPFTPTSPPRACAPEAWAPLPRPRRRVAEAR